VTTLFERRPTIFIPLPPGIAAMWDGLVHEQKRRRGELNLLGRCRVLCTSEGEWQLQVTTSAEAKARDALHAPAWTTWHKGLSAEALGAAERPPEAGFGAEPPFTTGQDGARWHRTQPSARYVGNRVPLFLGRQEEAGEGLDDGGKGGGAAAKKKASSKLSKDAIRARKTYAFITGDNIDDLPVPKGHRSAAQVAERDEMIQKAKDDGLFRDGSAKQLEGATLIED